MPKPRIADLFCGAGGSARGLQRAGFYVVGYDINPQPRYAGDEFHQQDALTVDLSPFDAAWASPPCQAYSIMRHLPWLRDKEYPRLIEATREMLEHFGLPYIIENVVGAPLLNYSMLCGGMFGRPFYRHRWFETTFFVTLPGHPSHRRVILSGGMLKGQARAITYKRPDGTPSTLANSLGGHRSTTEFEAAKDGMQIDWMTRNELSQAIPPAYSEWIGRQLWVLVRNRDA